MTHASIFAPSKLEVDDLSGTEMSSVLRSGSFSRVSRTSRRVAVSRKCSSLRVFRRRSSAATREASGVALNATDLVVAGRQVFALGSRRRTERRFEVPSFGRDGQERSVPRSTGFPRLRLRRGCVSYPMKFVESPLKSVRAGFRSVFRDGEIDLCRKTASPAD